MAARAWLRSFTTRRAMRLAVGLTVLVAGAVLFSAGLAADDPGDEPPPAPDLAQRLLTQSTEPGGRPGSATAAELLADSRVTLGEYATAVLREVRCLEDGGARVVALTPAEDGSQFVFDYTAASPAAVSPDELGQLGITCHEDHTQDVTRAFVGQDDVADRNRLLAARDRILSCLGLLADSSEAGYREVVLGASATARTPDCGRAELERLSAGG